MERSDEQLDFIGNTGENESNNGNRFNMSLRKTADNSGLTAETATDPQCLWSVLSFFLLIISLKHWL